MNALVFWLAHLLLILQTSCKLSDNDLGVSVSYEFLAELIVILATIVFVSATLIHQLGKR